MVASNLLIQEIEASLTSNSSSSYELMVGADARFSCFGHQLNSLPVEILAEIFDWTGCLEDSSFREKNLFPLRLAHVSARWRKIVTRTPRLWMHLRVLVRGQILGPALEMIRHWLERCGSCDMLIEVCFKDANGTEPAYLEDVLSLFRRIAKEAALHRHDFSMVGDGAVFETKLRAASIGVVPVIEEQYLWYGGVREVPDKENGLIAPFVIRGNRLAVDTFGLEYHGPLSASLTSVDLQDASELYSLSSMELLIILAEFPLLKRCAAHINNATLHRSERVLTTNLECLSLSWHYTVDVGPFLDRLTTPSLKDLEVMGDTPGSGEWSHLLNYIRRSNPPLKSFTFIYLDGNAAGLEECLNIIAPTLQALWLENCDIDDDFMSFLGKKLKHGRSILDGLKRLGLVSIQEITGSRLVDTLNLKVSNADQKVAGECMDEVMVYDCPGVSKGDFQNLNQLGFQKVEYIDATFCSGVEMEGVSDDDSPEQS